MLLDVKESDQSNLADMIKKVYILNQYVTSKQIYLYYSNYVL